MLIDAVRVRELVAVLRALDGAGAQPVVFKGAALAHTHYAESWQRSRYDADILIAPESRERVCTMLEARGYVRRVFISGDLVMQQAPFERVDHLGIEHALDVHWRIANPHAVSLVLTHEELARQGGTVRVLDYPMRVPSAVDSLLIACVHRAVHHPDFEKPIWIEDIHLLASGLAPPEWQSFVERAARRSICAICAQGLRLARDRFHTEIPADVLAVLDAAKGEASAVFLRRDLRPVDRLASDVRALGPLNGARLVREHLFPPVAYMQAAYGVRSRALLPAYYAARVVGGISKWLRAFRAA